MSTAVAGGSAPPPPPPPPSNNKRPAEDDLPETDEMLRKALRDHNMRMKRYRDQLEVWRRRRHLGIPMRPPDIPVMPPEVYRYVVNHSKKKKK